MKLLAASAAMVLLAAAAVWLELRLVGAAGNAGLTWRGVILCLLAFLFVPALVLGAAFALYARRRRAARSQ